MWFGVGSLRPVPYYKGSMLQYYRSTRPSPAIKSVAAPKKGDWIRVERPADDEVGLLMGMGMDKDILTDALDPHEVPRIESDDGWTYFITRVPDVGDDFNDFTTPLMFATNLQYGVTVSRDALGRLWQPFIDKTPVPTCDTATLFILMMEMISGTYQTRVSAINRQMRSVTNDLERLRPKDIATIVEYERKLNDYLDALIPTNTAIEKTLVSKKLIPLSPDDKELLEDLSVDFEQVIARCKSLLRTITNVRDSYRAVMDTRLNETMRVLTVATLSLTIPTMRAGVFGMNVKLPFSADSMVPFWLIIAISVLAAVLISAYFLRKR